MKFTDQELRMFSKLKKEQLAWNKYGKWVFLIAGLIVFIMTIFMTKMVFDMTIEVSSKNEALANIWTLILAMMFPKIYLFACLSGFMLSKAIFQFRGDPVKALLIKLIEEK